MNKYIDNTYGVLATGFSIVYEPNSVDFTDVEIKTEYVVISLNRVLSSEHANMLMELVAGKYVILEVSEPDFLTPFSDKQLAAIGNRGCIVAPLTEYTYDKMPDCVRFVVRKAHDGTNVSTQALLALIADCPERLFAINYGITVAVTASDIVEFVCNRVDTIDIRGAK